MNTTFRNEILLDFDVANIRIASVLVLAIDIFCHFVLDKIYFSGDEYDLVHTLRLYVWISSVSFVFFSTFFKGIHRYLRLIVCIAILSHGHVYMVASFFLGLDGIIYGAMYAIIAAVLMFFPFNFSSKITLYLVRSMVGIYWVSVGVFIYSNLPHLFYTDRLVLRVLAVPEIEEVFLAFFGSTAVIVLLDFCYYHLTSKNTLIRNPEKILSEYDAKRLMWLEGMSRYLKHELVNDTLSIKIELSNLKKRNESVRNDTAISEIARTVENIESLVSGMSHANDLENALVPRNIKTTNLSTYLQNYARSYISQRENVSLVTKFAISEMQVACDDATFVQMLDNVVSNCVDYAEDASDVEVDLFSRNGTAIIEVSNRGEYIQKNHLESIFKLFVGRSSFGHFGFGLFIAKTVAEYHRGRIFAKNTEKGPAFIIEIPAVDSSKTDLLKARLDIAWINLKFYFHM